MFRNVIGGSLSKGLLLVLLGMASVAYSSDAENRAITSAPTVAVGAVTAVTTFTAATTSSTSAKLTFTWDFGDGTPTVTNSAATTTHIYLRPFPYIATLTTTEAGNPTPVVKTLTVNVTDAIKSPRFLANFNFSKPGKDNLFFAGVVKVPANPDALKGKNVTLNIGGMLLGFTLDDRLSAKFTTNANTVSGVSSNSNLKGVFKLYVRKRRNGVQYSDARFFLRLNNSSILPSWADELVFNRDADKETIRFTATMVFQGLTTDANLGVTSNGNGNSTYSVGLTPNLIAKQNGPGRLR
jgi:PKD repeat protein